MYKKYMDLLTKYNIVKQNVTQPFEIEVKTKTPEGNESQQNRQIEPGLRTQETVPPTSKQQIPNHGQPESSKKVKPSLEKYERLDTTIAGMPPIKRYKAMKVIRSLERDPRIEWDGEGRIYFKKKYIKGSDINKILNDLMNVRKNTSPGFTEIALTLQKNKFPRRNIVNADQYEKISRNINRKMVKGVMRQYEESDGEEDEKEQDLNKTINQEGLGLLSNYKQCQWCCASN
jgi:hypothetical protein